MTRSANISRRCRLALLFAAFAVHPGMDAAASPFGAVPSAASAEVAGRTIRLRVTGASGLFGKTLSVRGRRVGEVQEHDLASIRYGGLGRAVSSTDWITLRNVSTAYLQMDIDPQFAMLGIHLHMRSDDPATSHYLFHMVGDQWVQLARDMAIDVFSYAGCGVRDFSWEDGGDFHHQDFFFQVDSGPDCVLTSSAADGALTLAAGP